MRRSSLALLLLFSACAGPQTLVCGGTQQSGAVAEVFFGRNIGGRLGVSDAAWQQFVAAEVTPRFPDGLTVVDAAGQWRDTAGNRVVRELSKLLIIVLPGRDDDQARLDAIAETYKRRFQQQSVLVVVHPACVKS